MAQGRFFRSRPNNLDRPSILYDLSQAFRINARISIDLSVSEYESGQLIPGQSAIIDFLSRSKPRINGHNEGPIAPSHDPGERLQQIIHAIPLLIAARSVHFPDRSHL
jgi:hypothetical protein